MSGAEGFVFVDSPAEFGDEAGLIVRIPPGIRSKQKLLAILATKLHFPRYFGWNWDALEECLRDLSWLPAAKPIVLVHEGLPFGAGGKNRSIYLEVLRAVLAHRQSSPGPKLSAVFPTAAQPELSDVSSKS